MTTQEWSKLLKSYRTPKRVATEALEGIVDHIDTSCSTGHNVTVATIGAGRRGLPPFREEETICNRGTRGCNLIHNDGQALVFARMAFERIVELTNK